MQVLKVKEGDIQTQTQTETQGRSCVKTKAGLREVAKSRGEKPAVGPLSLYSEEMALPASRCRAPSL